jgi:hypothetical protein
VTRPQTTTSKGETFGSPTLALARTFTPQTLQEAVLAGRFPQNLLPSGFAFDGQKSPEGKPYATQGFSTPEKAQQHHLVGAGAVALATATPGQTFQITFLSFAEPASAEAYMQEARNATAVQAPAGQPVCGAVAGGVVVGCSVAFENVVVEGRAKSTTGQPIADVNPALATTSALAQAGVTYLHQIKGA